MITFIYRHPLFIITLLLLLNSLALIPNEPDSILFSPTDEYSDNQFSQQPAGADTSASDKSFVKTCYDYLRIDKWSDERRYRVLSSIFDGVPLPPSMQPVPVIPSIDSMLPSLDTTSISLETQKPIADALFVHKPYAEKRCFECHEMDSGNKFGANIGSLCYTCHQDYSNLPGFIHGPVAIGLCQGCHNPHSSKYEFLLARAGDELCTFCHDMLSKDDAGPHQVTPEQTCLECHNPHNANNDVLLVMESDSL